MPEPAMNVPADGNAGATGQATVLEAGLTGPATTETTAGTINVGSPDGLTSVKVGGLKADEVVG
mgnify:CR=1 FL=1